MKKYALFMLYGLMFLFFLFKMFYYREELGYVPDEEAHISYLAYLEENPVKLLPDFEQMLLCEDGLSEENGIVRYRVYDYNACYLRHPSLYYTLLKLTGGIISVETESGCYVYADVKRLKTANIYLIGFMLLLVFYIGYTRLKKRTDSCMIHGLYVTAAVSVPMLALCGSGVTNNNLANLGVVVCMLGMLRHCEDKKGYLTYLLMAAGFFTAVLSRFSAGELLIVMLLVLFAADMLKNKNLGPFQRREFLVTLLIYLFAGVYCILFSLQNSSGFTVGSTDMTFFGYAAHFFKQLRLTWTGLYNGRGIQGSIFLLLFYAPFILTITAGIQMFFARQKDQTAIQENNTYHIFHAAFLAGLIVLTAVQLLNGYNHVSEYTEDGPAGYYLCAVPFMAFALAEGGRLLLERKPQKSSLSFAYHVAVHVLLAAVILWMLYGDFIYFLATNNAY